MNSSDTLKHQIALSLVPGLGPVTAKKLIAHFGAIRPILNANQKELTKVPGIGSVTSKSICSQDFIALAEKEIQFIEKYKIQALFYLDPNYPVRLKRCVDAPLVLYSKGNIEFNAEKTVAIVGTRNATDYGKEFCNKLIEAMAEREGYCVISGLAYGIDIAAHKACIKNNIPTIGILGHGLDKIYPQLHKKHAQEMIKDGGLATDFISGSKIDRNNFLRRNRIIAGLTDATIIVESAEKGGSLVTADIANSYNRDVFALPGRIFDMYSKGCNQLIKQNKAAMIEKLEDLEYAMSWQPDIDNPQKIQRQLFIELSPLEEKITEVIKESPKFIDQICNELEISTGKASSLLLDLEFKGIVSSLPGKMYKLN